MSAKVSAKIPSPIAEVQTKKFSNASENLEHNTDTLDLTNT
jgi:hypothetical protein